MTKAQSSEGKKEKYTIFSSILCENGRSLTGIV